MRIRHFFFLNVVIFVPTKKLFVLVGLPFSGKTTWVREFVADFVTIISRDEILEQINKDVALRARLFIEAQSIIQPESKIFDEKEKNAWNDVVTKEYVRQVIQKVQKSESEVVIVDGTHLSSASRKFVAGDFGRMKIAVQISTSKDLCIDRWRQTHTSGIRSSITEELIQKMDALREDPLRSEGFDEILLV